MLVVIGLPVAMPPGLEIDALMDKMALDKKNEAGKVRCTMVLDIGDCKPQVRGPMHGRSTQFGKLRWLFDLSVCADLCHRCSRSPWSEGQWRLRCAARLQGELVSQYGSHLRVMPLELRWMGPMGKRLLRSASLLDYGGASLIPRGLSESEPAVRVNGTCL